MCKYLLLRNRIICYSQCSIPIVLQLLNVKKNVLNKRRIEINIHYLYNNQILTE